MNRVFLGKAEHWAILVVFVGVLWALGERHTHVRAFLPFWLIVMGMALAAVTFIVWRHNPGDTVTREPIDDAALPHGGRDIDEV